MRLLSTIRQLAADAAVHGEPPFLVGLGILFLACGFATIVVGILSV